MKEKKLLILILIFLAAALLCLLCVKPLYYVYRELEYHLGQPTRAEQIVHNYAEEKGVSYGRYPKDLITLLDRNPETEEFVLGYLFRQEQSKDISRYSREDVPLFLQWDPAWGYEEYGSSYLAVTGCGPTCLAMVGYYLTGDSNMMPDQVASFSEKNGYYENGYGSSWTLISEGSVQLGLIAKELPLVKKKLVDALQAGNPVILAMGEGDFTTTGHYIVLTGVENDAFRVNDPNSRLRSEKLWTYEELEGQIRTLGNWRGLIQKAAVQPLFLYFFQKIWYAIYLERR